MTLRTGEDALIWRRRLWIALCGGIVLEEALDLSSDRILNEWMNALCETLKVIKFWATKNVEIAFLSLCDNIQIQYVDANFWCLVVSSVQHCCNDTVSSSDYTPSNGRVKSERWTGRDLEGIAVASTKIPASFWKDWGKPPEIWE